MQRQTDIEKEQVYSKRLFHLEKPYDDLHFQSLTEDLNKIRVPGDGYCAFGSIALGAIQHIHEGKLDLAAKAPGDFKVALVMSLSDLKIRCKVQEDEKLRDALSEIIQFIESNKRKDPRDFINAFQNQFIKNIADDVAAKWKIAALMYVLGAAFRGVAGFDNEKLENPNEWGDDGDINCLAKKFGININVYQENAGTKAREKIDFGHAKINGNPEISILYSPGHYDYLAGKNENFWLKLKSTAEEKKIPVVPTAKPATLTLEPAKTKDDKDNNLFKPGKEDFLSEKNVTELKRICAANHWQTTENKSSDGKKLESIKVHKDERHFLVEKNKFTTTDKHEDTYAMMIKTFHQQFPKQKLTMTVLDAAVKKQVEDICGKLGIKADQYSVSINAAAPAPAKKPA